MNHTLNILDCQDAVNFVPIRLLIRSKRFIPFYSRVSTNRQDHRKYIAALKAAYNCLHLPMPFTLHEYTGSGRLDGAADYFTWLGQKIPNTEDVVCVFPALDRMFRPAGFSQFDPTTWRYQESDFELFRQQLEEAGHNPDKITFALLNGGVLESDRTFETRLGENHKTMHKTGKIDPKTSERLQAEVRKLRTLGMTPPDIYFHFAVRLERVAERTVRGWCQGAGAPSKWDDVRYDVIALAHFYQMNAAQIHRQFISEGKEITALRTVQDWLHGAEYSSKRGKPKSS